MNRVRLLATSFLVLGALLLFQSAQPASAAFHLIRIHAVMSGFNGVDTIQFVELRMCSPGQPLVGTHTLIFRDSAGTLKATFTFPTMVGNSSMGDSILVATSEYDANNIGPLGGGAGAEADFLFTGNTVGANLGDPDHPVQGPNGRVEFASGEGEGCDTDLALEDEDADSVAYGTAPSEVGTAAVPLPSPTDNMALRESDLIGPVANNSDYALAPVATAPATVPVNMLALLDFPRNNSRQVGQLSMDADGDSVTIPTDVCPGTAVAAPVDASGCSDAQVDTDGDGFCNAAPPPAGPSGCTGVDNCPSIANPTQANVDGPPPLGGDAIGDACDTEGPSPNTNGVGDGVGAGTDDCLDAVDNDGDTLTDAADGGCSTTDIDGDTIPDVIDNCPMVFNPGQENFDGDSMGNACDPEDDGDGYTDSAEGGTPLCGNGLNEDGSFGDDVVVNDGCPGGPAMAGSFSEAEFNIGTNILGRCEVGQTVPPSSHWAADLAANGSFSGDKVNISDLALFILPTRWFGSDPSDGAGFNERFDVVPGTTFGVAWINITDLSNVAFLAPPMPPYSGTRAFGGAVCTDPP